nr:unnamed protein product [Digitaria exilis]
MACLTDGTEPPSRAPEPLSHPDPVLGRNREAGGGGEAMEKSPPEPAPAAAAEEVAARFRSLVDPDHVASIRQTQHLIRLRG